MDRQQVSFHRVSHQRVSNIPKPKVGATTDHLVWALHTTANFIAKSFVSRRRTPLKHVGSHDPGFHGSVHYVPALPALVGQSSCSANRMNPWFLYLFHLFCTHCSFSNAKLTLLTAAA